MNVGKLELYNISPDHNTRYPAAADLLTKPPNLQVVPRYTAHTDRRKSDQEDIRVPDSRSLIENCFYYFYFLVT